MEQIPGECCPCSSSLCLQIPAEESEDEAAAGEERLSEQDPAGDTPEGSRDRSQEGAVTPSETHRDGQRGGQEAEQPDRMVTAARDMHFSLGLTPGEGGHGGAGAWVCVEDTEGFSSCRERGGTPGRLCCVHVVLCPCEH